MLNELHSFIVLAERKNFSEAAKQLFIQQPGLSRQVSKLEEELHVRLFNRNTHSVELTTSGKLFLAAAVEFYRSCQMIPEKSPSDSLDAPQIIIGAGDIIENVNMPWLLDQLVKKNPAARISIQRYPDTELMTHFFNDEIDFAEVFIEMVPDSSSYDYIVLSEAEVKVAVWENHPLASKGKVSLEELKNEWFVMNSSLTDASRNCVYQMFADANFAPKISGRSNDSRARFQMVGAKQGITITAVSGLYDTPRGVVFLDLTDQKPDDIHKKLVLVWNKERCNIYPHIRQFVSILKNNL